MIYLLHLNTPYKHARHYVGYTKTPEGLEARLKKHANGSGARLMEVIAKHGIGFTLARTWKDGTRDYERYLKNLNDTPRLCPICNPNAMKSAFKLYTSDDVYTLSLNVPPKESTTYAGTIPAIDTTKEIT